MAKKPAPAKKSPSPAKKPATKVAPKASPKVAKPTPKPAAKAAAKPAPKAPAKTTKVETKLAKPEIKTAKVETKPAKVDAKPAKVDPKKLVKAPEAKPAAKTADAKPGAKAPEVAKAAEGPKGAPPVDPNKTARKGITIVTPKPMKRPKPKPVGMEALAAAGRLADSKNPIMRKPLIASGPSAAPRQTFGAANPDQPAKSPFKKPELDRFRQILLRKRAELVGDVSNMEEQALQGGGSGSLSHTPQHLAEQGSETYDQSLALDLAAADRKLIKEIDDALKRIDDGTYGVCEMTGKPIKPERLEELPWARFSIEAAREMERRAIRIPVQSSSSASSSSSSASQSL